MFLFETAASTGTKYFSRNLRLFDSRLRLQKNAAYFLRSVLLSFRNILGAGLNLIVPFSLFNIFQLNFWTTISPPVSDNFFCL